MNFVLLLGDFTDGNGEPRALRVSCHLLKNHIGCIRMLAGHCMYKGRMFISLHTSLCRCEARPTAACMPLWLNSVVSEEVHTMAGMGGESIHGVKFPVRPGLSCFDTLP